MTLYKPGDVVLVKFPFTSGAGSKLRPALVILDTGDDDLVVARITTHTSLTPLTWLSLTGAVRACLLRPTLDSTSWQPSKSPIFIEPLVTCNQPIVRALPRCFGVCSINGKALGT